VVIGYGTQSKRDLTGSVSSIKGEQIASLPIQSFDQALQGRAAGVNITTPNGVVGNPPVIRVRGVNSINLSSYPLIVIDGVPTFTADNSTNGNGGLSSNSAANNPLANLNPADIESIEVLKDASASAIYGSRASAGVILITTKRGKSGKARIAYDGWSGWSQPVRLFEMMNASEYMELKNEGRANAAQPEAFFPSYDNSGKLIDTDWYDYVYRTGFSHSHNVSVSGGSEATTYYTSLGYTNQQGMIKQNEFNRYIGRLNLDHKVYDRFRVGLSLAYSNSLTEAPNTGSLPGQAFNTGGLGRLPLVLPPNVGPYLNTGGYNVDGAGLGPMNNTVTTSYYNPVVILDNDYFSSEGNQIQGNVYANWEILKGLNLRTSYGIDRLNIEDISYQSPLGGDGFANRGVARNTIRKNRRWNWQNTVQYDFSFLEKNSVSVLVGGEQQYTQVDRWGAQRTGVSDNFFETFQGSFDNIVPTTIANTGSGTENLQGQNYLLSYFGRVNYDFGKKYFLSFNFRRDGYSAFAPGRKYGNFYGGAVAYTLSEEEFWKGSELGNVLSFFKLRASYGVVGNNQGIDDFASLRLYGAGLYGAAYSIFFSQPGNNLLSWETSKKTDLGFNFGLLNDRITGEFVWYNNRIEDIILRVPQAASKGIPDPSNTFALNNTLLSNVGSMVNRGIEISLSATPVRNDAFGWTVSANLTTLKNKVLALNSEDAQIRTPTSTLETANITTVGRPVGSLVAVPTAGVNQENGRRLFVKGDGTVVQYDHAAPAASRWTTLDGTPATAPSLIADGQIYGPTLPTWYGGFDNTFRYKNFDLGVFLQFSGGNSIYNGTKAGLRDQRFWNNTKEVYRERWTAEKGSGSIPRIVFNDNVSNGSSFPISENIEKGDFLRGRNISLGYTLERNLLNRVKIASARIYVQVQNAFLITNYEGIDPEISTNGNSNLAPGIDRNSSGQARTYTVGINLGI
jgi:TonB-linked SusC/RagA family outer membrane protein